LMDNLTWLLVFLLLASGCIVADAAPELTGELQITVPAQIVAGQDIPITVRGVTLTENDVHLTLFTSAGVHTERVRSVAGRAQLFVYGRAVSSAGVVLVYARSGAAVGRASFEIVPGPAVGPLHVLVSPRTVVADGRDRSMVVVIPHDQFGNALLNGTPMDVRAETPGGRVALRSALYTGVSWAWLPAGTRAGRVVVSAMIDAQAGLAGDLDVVAGRPVVFGLVAEPASAAADGRQLMILRTDLLRDQYQNVLPDGTAVVFVVVMPDGSQQRIPAQTIGGVAQAPLQAATMPGIAAVMAVAEGVASRTQYVEFGAGPAQGRIPVTVALQASERLLIVQIGPLIGPLGELVADGTLIEVQITDSTGQIVSANGATRAGQATIAFELNRLAPGVARARVELGSAAGEQEFVVR
jgi:hypothetical protein